MQKHAQKAKLRNYRTSLSYTLDLLNLIIRVEQLVNIATDIIFATVLYTCM